MAPTFEPARDIIFLSGIYAFEFGPLRCWNVLDGYETCSSFVYIHYTEMAQLLKTIPHRKYDETFI